MSVISQEGGEVKRFDDPDRTGALRDEEKIEQEKKNGEFLEILLEEFPNAFYRPPITDSQGVKVYKVGFDKEKNENLSNSGLWPVAEFKQLVWEERGEDRDPVLMALTQADGIVYFSNKGIAGFDGSSVSSVDRFLKEGGAFEDITGVRKDFLDSYPKEDQNLFFKEMAFQEKIIKMSKDLEKDQKRLSPEDFRSMAREAKQGT